MLYVEVSPLYGYDPLKVHEFREHPIPLNNLPIFKLGCILQKKYTWAIIQTLFYKLEQTIMLELCKKIYSKTLLNLVIKGKKQMLSCASPNFPLWEHAYSWNKKRFFSGVNQHETFFSTESTTRVSSNFRTQDMILQLEQEKYISLLWVIKCLVNCLLREHKYIQSEYEKRFFFTVSQNGFHQIF